MKQVRYKFTILSWNTCLMRKSYDLEHHIKTIISFSFSQGVWKIVLLISLVGLDSVHEILQSSPVSNSIFTFIVCHTLLLVPMAIVLSSFSSSSSSLLPSSSSFPPVAHLAALIHQPSLIYGIYTAQNTST